MAENTNAHHDQHKNSQHEAWWWQHHAFEILFSAGPGRLVGGDEDEILK